MIVLRRFSFARIIYRSEVRDRVAFFCVDCVMSLCGTRILDGILASLSVKYENYNTDSEISLDRCTCYELFGKKFAVHQNSCFLNKRNNRETYTGFHCR